MKVNYHMHTSRCHHALGSDEDYIRAAIQAGFDEVGFADHTPWRYPDGYVSGMRMKESELDGYIESIQRLQKKYQNQISVKIGLECEYFPEMMPWLEETLKEKPVNFIILGNHFHLDDMHGRYYGWPTESEEVLLDYVSDVKAALAAGLYSYIAHPDLVHYRHPEDEIYRKAMTELCLAAKAADTPLEFNLLGYREHRQYPCEAFWKIASACQCQAIIGFDAHEPARLKDNDLYQQAKDYLFSLNLEIVDKIRFLK